jgi:hypothetical protein
MSNTKGKENSTSQRIKTCKEREEERDVYRLDNCPPLFGQNILAEILDCTEAWCEKARYQGTGPRYRKLNGLIRYTRGDTQQYINENAYQSTSQREPVTSINSDGEEK